ncbi:MAG: glycosyltransferase family 2 protein [Ilumatobacteraceae bacterium]
MIREVSVITAVRPDYGQFLPETWRSLSSQELPANWRLRWYVQEDGEPSEIRSFIQSLAPEAVDYASSGSHGGVAEARNLALARTSGDVVMILDADDRMTAGAVARSLQVLASGYEWCGFAAVDDHDGRISVRDGRYSVRLYPDGSLPTEANAFVKEDWVGDFAKGALRSCWEEFGLFPFHPTTFATATQFVWDVGGWPGLARDEDTALILAISDRHHGVVSDETNLIYRRHALQTSRNIAPNSERIKFIRRRICSYS